MNTKKMTKEELDNIVVAAVNIYSVTVTLHLLKKEGRDTDYVEGMKKYNEFANIKDESWYPIIWGKEFELMKFIENSFININAAVSEDRNELCGIYSVVLTEITNLQMNCTVDKYYTGYTNLLEPHIEKINLIMERVFNIDAVVEGTQPMPESQNIIPAVNPVIEPIAGEVKEAIVATEVVNELDKKIEESEKEIMQTVNKTEEQNIKDLELKQEQEEVKETQEQEEVKETVVEVKNQTQADKPKTTDDDSAKLNALFEKLNAGKHTMKIKVEQPPIMDQIVDGVIVGVATAAVLYAGLALYDALTSKDNGNGFL